MNETDRFSSTEEPPPLSIQFIGGQKARLLGYALGENPYAKDSNRAAWAAGWADADAGIQAEREEVK